MQALGNLISPVSIASRRVVWTPANGFPGVNTKLWMRGDTGLKTGGARHQDPTSSEYFNASGTSLASAVSTANKLTFCGFFNIDLIDSTSNRFGGIYDYGNSQRSFALDHDTATNRFQLFVSSDGSAVASVVADTFGNASTGTWYFVCGEYDGTNLLISVNDGTQDSTADSNGIHNSTADFVLGSLLDSGATETSGLKFDGKMSKIGLADEELTAAERTWLYNNGNGRVSGEVDAHATLGPIGGAGKFIEYWNQNESSGNGVSFTGSNDLTENGTISAVDGPAVELAADSSGNGHTGVLTGGGEVGMWSTDVATGASGLSLALDGSSQSVISEDIDALDGVAAMSVSFWMKWTNSSSGWKVAIGKTNGSTGWGILMDNNAVGDLEFFDGAGSHGRYTATKDAWVHVVAVFDGSLSGNTNRLKIYEDGVSQTLTYGGTIPATLQISSSAVVIGDRASTPQQLFGGNLDEIHIYDDALTADEVTFLFNEHTGGSGGTDPTGANLTLHYKFDDGPQSPITDQDPVIEWESKEGNLYQFQQATAAKRGLARTGANGINSQTVVEFDGADDLLVYVGTITTATVGTLPMTIETGASAFAADQVIWASSDEAGALNYLEGGIDSAGKVYIEANDAGTVHRVTGDTVLSVSTVYQITFASSGTAWVISVDGADETLTVTTSNSGKWFGDISGRDNFTLGARKDATENSHFEGKLPEKILYDADLSDANEATSEAYLATRYGT